MYHVHETDSTTFNSSVNVNTHLSIRHTPLIAILMHKYRNVHKDNSHTLTHQLEKLVYTSNTKCTNLT